MARIATVKPDTAEGPLAELLAMVRQEYGYVPGISQIMLVDVDVAWPVRTLYHHLNLRTDSPFTRLQREMVGTVVNGLVGGAP